MPPEQQSGSSSIVVSSQQAAGLPANFGVLTFDGFETLNTKPTRSGIGDQEMFWCDNFMPLGKNNLRTLYGPGPTLFTSPGGKTIGYMAFGNVGNTATLQHLGTPYSFAFLSDGSAVQINVATTAQTTIAGTGTFAVTQLATAQYGNQFLIIVCNQPNGYFIWDGINLYTAGTLGATVSILNSGLGYSSAPTVTAVGGVGSGATFSATAANGAITLITVTNPGTGYQLNDQVILAFSGGGSAFSTATATATIAGGAITAVTMNLNGAGYTQATTKVLFLGGGGTGATGTVTVTAGGVTGIAVTSGGQGYSTPPTVFIRDTANPVAVAQVAIMPFGVKGTAVETFSSRVWVTDFDQIQFTAPGSVSDFGAPDGGGQFESNDSFLRVRYSQLRQTNGFLYLIGDSSVNYISGVQTTGNPPLTTFTNQNVDPQIGSPWPNTVQVYSRAVVFANSFGVHALYGGAVQKVSSQLDGIYTTVPVTAFGSFIPSSAVAVIFGIHVYLLLLPIIDPISGQRRNALMCWDGKRWWTANPGFDLIQIATQEINSVITAWGTDGNKIVPLFQTPSVSLQKIVQSKLWWNPSFVATKHVLRVYGLFQSNTAVQTTVSVSVDSEIQSQTVPLNSLFQIVWTNNSNAVVAWKNNSNNAVVWAGAGTLIAGSQVDVAGSLIGFTVTSSAPDFTAVALNLVLQTPYRWNL